MSTALGIRMVLNVRDRVFYVDNGPHDTGTIISTSTDTGGVWYSVAWDDEEVPCDSYRAGQLSKVAV